jgi:perosamine synthetase
MALKVLGIGPGQEVIVPNFTFIASANAVTMAGATPVFCDVGLDLQIDLESARKTLTRKTVAVMPVHMYGMSANMPAVLEFAKTFGLKVIEDAAQAIGVNWGEKHAGTWGDAGTFSFFADKTLTTGEGGFVSTNSHDVFEKLLYFRNQGRLDRGSFIHPETGYNFRMTDMQSAIGNKQLDKLDFIIGDKQRIIAEYTNLLDDAVKPITPPIASESNHVPFRVAIRIPGGKEKVIAGLTEAGIEPRTFFYPLNEQPCYTEPRKSSFFRAKLRTFPVARGLFDEGVCLPSWVGLPSNSIRKISEVVNALVRS